MLRGSQPQPSPAVIRLSAASALSVRQTWRANTKRGSLRASGSRPASTIWRVAVRCASRNSPLSASSGWVGAITMTSVSLASFLEALAAVHGGPLEDQRQLGPPGVQQRQRIGLRRGQHLDLQQRMLARQRGERVAPARGQQLGSDRQRQPVLQALRQPERLHLQLPELRRQQPRLRLQRARCRGRPGLAAGAVEQRQVELGLQVGDGHADRRRHAAQRTGRGREGAVVEHGEEDLDVVAGKGQSIRISERR